MDTTAFIKQNILKIAFQIIKFQRNTDIIITILSGISYLDKKETISWSSSHSAMDLAVRKLCVRAVGSEFCWTKSSIISRLSLSVARWSNVLPCSSRRFGSQAPHSNKSLSFSRGPRATFSWTSKILPWSSLLTAYKMIWNWKLTLRIINLKLHVGLCCNDLVHGWGRLLNICKFTFTF